ncbi:hypothetical protein [Brevibacterium sp. 'Marine']|uniref:hypothetical protein n=1 Tax=Brevibacterium sp. 'Marine' TaxID=2725563 RepID=UPI00145CF5D5|nr:hypothetical protein [Brevibacterium sp. 'Marine']
MSPAIVDVIEEFCGCKVHCDLAIESVDWRTGFAEHAVSFSGGFDSLAAWTLLPGDPTLISMDFGGWFKRETEFFVEFSPQVVSTNFRMEGFGRRSWIFMLAGVILLKQHLNIGRYTTGSILESSPWNYRKNIDQTFKAAPLLHGFGFEQVNTTLGITEVGTTLLAMRHYPNLIGRSLDSLAAPGSGKSLRKQMLVESLYREKKADLNVQPVVASVDSPPLKWGQSLTDDMLTPYMIKHCGLEASRRLMADIPDDVISLAQNSRLHFYERYHTGLYMGIPEEIGSHLRETLYDSGIVPFTELDWLEYRTLTELLSAYHELNIN